MTAQNNLSAANTGENFIVLAANSTANDSKTEFQTEIETSAKDSVGMPQFDPSTYPNQALWLIITLIFIYFLLARIGLPRIAGVLEQRSNTIQRDLDRAAEMKAKAQQAEQNYQQALTDARAKANGIVEDAKAKAQDKLDAAIAKADSEIEKQAQASSKRIADMQKNADKTVAEVAKEITGIVIEAVSPGSNDDKLAQSTLTKLLKG